MNKKIFFMILVCFLTLITFIIFSFKNEIFDFLINGQNLSFRNISIYLILGFLYFLTPLPATIVIIMTGFLFKSVGFFISIILVLFTSFLLFVFARNIKKVFNLNLNQFLPKKINLKKIVTNNYSILISRYILPYFFHNIVFGLENIKLKRFLIVITFAEIPMIFALNTLGMTLNMIVKNYKISFLDIIFDENFYLPFIIMITIFVVINLLKKNFKIGL